MEHRQFYEKALYRILGGAILACICLFSPFFGLAEVTWKCFPVLCVVLILFTGVSLFPARGKILCLLLMALCLGVPVVVMEVRTGFTYLRSYFIWCLGDGGDPARQQESFRMVHTAVITGAAFLVQVLSEKFKALKFGLALGCAVSLPVCLFARITMTHMGVVFMLLYIVAVLAEWLQERWEKRRSGGLKEQMLWLSPFLCAYLLLMAVMPAPETPYGWEWAVAVYSQVRESFVKISQNMLRGGREDLDTSLSGFSGEGELRGDVREDDREVMHLQAQSSFMTNVYLIGRIYDTFDGRQWLQEYDGEEEERFMDALETLYAVERLDREYQEDYISETRMRIRYEFFNTGYVFAPLKTRSITGRGTALEYSFQGGSMLLGKRKGYGAEYDVTYYQLNAGEELFERLLEENTDPDGELWETIARGYQRQTGRRITDEMLQAHRQQIAETYLDQVTLSEEAESYLELITRDAETDLEKLRAIERELGSFTYTRTPGGLPDSVTDAGDFLDFFLLESRQGYCTYFATAFVLLARAEGIPARYVQGFCVPARGSREAAVLSGMSHSWPEVYIEDVGWIPFEPTPGYGVMRYASWQVSARGAATSQGTGGLAEGEPEDTLTEPAEEPEMGGEQDDQDAWRELRSDRLWRIIVRCAAAVLGAAVSVLLADHLLGMYRYRRMSGEAKLKAEVRKNLRVLSWLGLKREEQETLQELRDRGEWIPEFASLRFIEDYEDVVYGGRTASGEMLERVKRERRQLWILLKRKNRAAYVFYRLWMAFMRYR